MADATTSWARPTSCGCGSRCKTCGCRATAPTCWTSRPITASRATSWSTCWAKCSRTRRPRRSSSANGCGCTSWSSAGWQERPWDHVFFHGGVPGPNRKQLVHRFREDPACRLFLATDAGGVGLNLQHASVVVNIDLPWNPAVLEQRIGRVHRLGQRRPVRVVDFIAQGTIEEGMLGLLKFKKSLFRRRARQRRGRGVPGRHAAEAVHGIGRKGHRRDPGVDAPRARSQRSGRRRPGGRRDGRPRRRRAAAGRGRRRNLAPARPPPERL